MYMLSAVAIRGQWTTFYDLHVEIKAVYMLSAVAIRGQWTTFCDLHAESKPICMLLACLLPYTDKLFYEENLKTP